MVTGSFVELVREWENRRRELRSREYLAGGDVFVWRLVSFIQDDREIDRMIGRARRHRALVLDLRSNPGGNLSALEHLVSRLFTDRVLVAVVEGRDGADTGWADPGRHPYTGSLVVLVDSESASAAEMLARIVQLEGRGTVVGDRTAGRVMTSFVLEDLAGAHLLARYAVSVTIGNVRMRDGRGLERVGVRPDSLVLPSTEDLAVGRDPVLAHAVSFLGGALTPEEAGQLFPRTRR
jgi:C-terminal processing protease CtpA/Prc